MASVCFTEQGDCLRDLGRLDEAAAAYEEGIRRAEQLGDDRQVAVGKGQLGTVRLLQRRYPEALAAYAEARERFTQLDEPGSVAVSWHQTGMVYQEAGQPEAAEDAYRKSLAIKVRLGDVAGQASTLGQLGNLYGDVLDRPEEAAAFYRQAADKYVEIGDVAGEGASRNNLAETLRKLRRLDEARQEIRRAIECKAQFGHASEPWKTWAHPRRHRDGRRQPRRRRGGEAQGHRLLPRLPPRRRREPRRRWPHLPRRDPVPARRRCGRRCVLLQQLAADPDLPSRGRTFIRALQAIVAGSRDRTLADAPDLDYAMAAEILFLIETLETPR